MEVICFLRVSLASSTAQLHASLVADAHAHVQWLDSVGKMATMFEKYTTEKQRSVVCFYGKKDSM
jgi:hypothetical protein